MNNETISKDKFFRDKWVHEDNLIDRRVTWLLIGQSLLFNAYAIAVCSVNNHDNTKALVDAMPYMGIALSLLIGASLVLGLCAQEYLKKQCTNIESKPGSNRFMGWLAPIGVAITFVIIWGYILTKG